jgi:hypothetical protein
MAQEITPDAIMQLGFGYWGSKTLLSAVEMALFTELAREPLALEDIQTRLNLHERSVRDFLDSLVALGMLKRERGTYANTPATDPRRVRLHGRRLFRLDARGRLCADARRAPERARFDGDRGEIESGCDELAQHVYCGNK